MFLFAASAQTAQAEKSKDRASPKNIFALFEFAELQFQPSLISNDDLF